jgi:LytS/YehU family sensor histidine kinase
LLIPLIENAFKHGMSQQTGDKWIRMHIGIVSGLLEVRIENSLSQIKDPDNSIHKVGGVGLENVAKRLKLLYPGAHEFRHERHADFYQVQLRIPLEVKSSPESDRLRSEQEPVPAFA